MSSQNINTRTRILKSTWKLLEAGQGKIVRMADIARQSGITRQALYLHFPNRADLLIATTRYLDEVNNIDESLEASRKASSGMKRLALFIEAWGNHIPKIFGVANALNAMKDNDEAARLAIDDRMSAVRHGCEAAVKALKKDETLSSTYSQKQAIDVLWTMLSIQNWEQLTSECEWTQKQYISRMQDIAVKMLVKESAELFLD